MSQKLSPAVIISIGDHADQVARYLGASYPALTRHLPQGADESAVARVVAEVTDGPTRPLEGHMELPGLLVIADTADHQTVLAVLDAIFAAETTAKPRVWPTFTSGTPSQLGSLDEALTTRGSGICDLVLMLTGTESADEQARALSAWLHVKMPAPASVLAQLPDSDGRICRYVALGSTVVSPGPLNGTTTAKKESTSDLARASEASIVAVDQVAVAATVNQELARVAADDATAMVARDAASALIAAAHDYDAPALMRAENNLAAALNHLDRRLVPELESALARIARAAVEQALLGGGAEAAPDASPQPPVGSDADIGRTQTVSELVLLASKGGLSKMFSRNRMATLAQALEPVARADVDTAVQQAVDHVSAQVGPLVTLEVKAATETAEQQRAQAAQEVGALRDQLWAQALATGRSAVTLWPTVSTTGITRAWGGGVPAPRQYLVGSAAALEGLAEDDAIMTVIDLRDVPGAPIDSVPVGESAAVGTRASDEAVVLLAQYGLPLAALG